MAVGRVRKIKSLATKSTERPTVRAVERKKRRYGVPEVCRGCQGLFLAHAMRAHKCHLPARLRSNSGKRWYKKILEANKRRWQKLHHSKAGRATIREIRAEEDAQMQQSLLAVLDDTPRLFTDLTARGHLKPSFRVRRVLDRMVRQKLAEVVMIRRVRKMPHWKRA